MSGAKDKQLATMDSVFRALGDPTRLRILGLLAAGGEVCVCHIHEALDCSQPMASRHLSYLRKAGLVEGRRDGQWIYYRVASMREPVMQTLMSAVTHCVGHLNIVGKDRKKLEKTCGCCCEETEQPKVTCC